MKTNFFSKPENSYSFVNGQSMFVETDTVRTVEPFKSLFPVREDVLARITADMKRYGFDNAHPIILWAGHNFTVVDGHTRLLAAKKLGIDTIPVVLREFEDEGKALEYAIDSQRNRRILTDAELLRCLSELDKRKKLGRPKGGGVDLGKSAEATAKVLGISRSKVERLRAVADHAAMTVKLAVLSGDLTVNKAYVITMEARNMNKCSGKDAIKAARLAALEKNICNVIHERTKSELIRHPGIRYTDSEIHALKGRIISKLSKEFGKLKEGN